METAWPLDSRAFSVVSAKASDIKELLGYPKVGQCPWVEEEVSRKGSMRIFQIREESCSSLPDHAES
jgi:hypothetical protein